MIYVVDSSPVKAAQLLTPRDAAANALSALRLLNNQGSDKLVAQWGGYGDALIRYAIWCLNHARRNGFNDSTQMLAALLKYGYVGTSDYITWPPVFRDFEIHASHRAFLKFYAVYEQVKAANVTVVPDVTWDDLVALAEAAGVQVDFGQYESWEERPSLEVKW